MSAYAEAINKHKGRVQCLLIRDVQSTEPVRTGDHRRAQLTRSQSDWRRPDSRAYVDIPDENYFFFRDPSDLQRIPVYHLEAMSKFPTNTTYTVTPGGNPEPVADPEELSADIRYRNTGCFPLQAHPGSHDFRSTKLPDSLTPSRYRLAGVKSVIRAA